VTRWVIHKTINEQKKILYYIHLYSVILYYILLCYYIILYYINITLYYIDISKKINKSWESFGWHVRASMDAHFPIALLCLYTLNVAGSPSYWKSQKKHPSNNSPGKNAETSMEIYTKSMLQTASIADLLTSRKPRRFAAIAQQNQLCYCRCCHGLYLAAAGFTNFRQSKLTGNGPTGARIGPNLPDGTYMQ